MTSPSAGQRPGPSALLLPLVEGEGESVRVPPDLQKGEVYPELLPLALDGAEDDQAGEAGTGGDDGARIEHHLAAVVDDLLQILDPLALGRHVHVGQIEREGALVPVGDDGDVAGIEHHLLAALVVERDDEGDDAVRTARRGREGVVDPDSGGPQELGAARRRGVLDRDREALEVAADDLDALVLRRVALGLDEGAGEDVERGRRLRGGECLAREAREARRPAGGGETMKRRGGGEKPHRRETGADAHAVQWSVERIFGEALMMKTSSEPSGLILVTRCRTTCLLSLLATIVLTKMSSASGSS